MAPTRREDMSLTELFLFLDPEYEASMSAAPTRNVSENDDLAGAIGAGGGSTTAKLLGETNSSAMENAAITAEAKAITAEAVKAAMEELPTTPAEVVTAAMEELPTTPRKLETSGDVKSGILAAKAEAARRRLLKAQQEVKVMGSVAKAFAKAGAGAKVIDVNPTATLPTIQKQYAPAVYP